MEFLSFLSMAGSGNLSFGTLRNAVLLFLFVRFILLIESFIKKNFDKGMKIKGKLKRGDANKHIHETLITPLQKLGGDRIQVVEYSNSNYNRAYVPFDYATITYEVHKPKLKPISETMQNVLTSNLGMFAIRLEQTHSAITLHSQDRDPDVPSNVYYYMELRGSLHSLSVPIRGPRKHKVIGYLNYDDNRGRFPPETLAELRNLANSIAVYLTLDGIE